LILGATIKIAAMVAAMNALKNFSLCKLVISIRLRLL
jgi:hypothetical protein